jgi:hypothetical protein
MQRLTGFLPGFSAPDRVYEAAHAQSVSKYSLIGGMQPDNVQGRKDVICRRFDDNAALFPKRDALNVVTMLPFCCHCDDKICRFLLFRFLFIFINHLSFFSSRSCSQCIQLLFISVSGALRYDNGRSVA